MIVGVCRLDVHLLESRSLKGKRRLIQRIKERIKRRFNVSVAEVDNHDLWQRATLGVCLVTTDSRFAHQVLSQVVNLVEQEASIQLLDYEIELR